MSPPAPAKHRPARAKDRPIRTEQSMFRLFNSFEDGVLVADTRTRALLFANARMARFLGYPQRGLEGKAIPDIHPKKSLPRVLSEYRALIRGRKAVSGDIPFLRRDGSVVYADARASNTNIGGRECSVGFFRDTSEHRKLKAELEESRERYASIFRHAGSCIAVYRAVENGRDFVIRDFNPAAERTERVRRKDVVGTRVTQAFPGVAEFGILEVFRQVWKTGRARRFPAKMYRDNRIAGWRDNFIFRLESGDVVAIYTDLTREKQAEERFHEAHALLQESEEKFRTLATYSLQGIIIASDKPVRILYSNPAMEGITGYSSKELSSMGPEAIERLIHPEDREAFFARFRKRLRGIPTTPRHEFRALRKDGGEAVLEVSAVPVQFGGRPAVQANFIDITERKRAEDGIKESGKRLSDIIDFLPDATFALDKDGRVMIWNKAIEEMTGVRAKHMLGKGNHEYALPFYGERRPGVAELLLAPDPGMEKRYVQLERSGGSITGSAYVRLKGRTRFVWVVAKSLCAPDGSVVGVIESIRDITEQKENQDSLMLQKKQIEELSRMKEVFVADLTHELKTPLSVILLNLDMVRKMGPGAQKAELEQYYDLMWRNSLRLNRSIDQIMGLTSSASVDIRIEKFDIDGIVRSVIEDYLPLARSKGIGLEMAGRSLEARCDPHIVAMALSNLVSNAIKFTDKGSVRVSWREAGDSAEIAVSDSGIGIRRENLDKVFQKFFKENHSAPGSGIGLAVSASLIERAGGRMEFVSEPGAGSTFMIILPRG